MIIKNFTPFIGQHCESTATGCLLQQIGVNLSEPMLFGLGEGLSYIFWNMKLMDFPFIGGRVKPDLLTENICRNLNLQLEVAETSSIAKAWQNVKKQLDAGNIVGIKLDSYHLDYFTSKIHFAGHYVAMYGYDDHDAYLVDTAQQGGLVRTSLENLELARNEKGPMSSRNRSYTIHKSEKTTSLEKAVKKAILKNASEYLHPPIKNVSYKGIAKTATELTKWYKNSKDVKRDFQMTSMLMERAGTGGSIFRNLYRDFLKESYDLLKMDGISEAYKDFKEIAIQWKMVSELFYTVGETGDMKYIEEASGILLDIAEKERLAMEKLRDACA